MGQRLGQHFLHDHLVLEDTAQEIFGLQHETGAYQCIEIGPGKGVLTSYLIDRFEELYLCEVDKHMKKYLSPREREGKATILWGDVLRHGFDIVSPNQAILTYSLGFLGETSSLPHQGGEIPLQNPGNPASQRQQIPLEPQSLLIVGNLPYYITSPIFRKFFVDPLIANGGVGGGAGGVFLIQHEVAEKIATQATKKSYLWWLLNVYYNVEYCFLVPARCFTPPPNVESAVVKLIKKDTHELTHEQFQRMIQFLDIVSPYKRKTLGKIMKIEQQAFATYGFELPEGLSTKRTEELTWEEMRHLVA